MDEYIRHKIRCMLVIEVDNKIPQFLFRESSDAKCVLLKHTLLSKCFCVVL